MRTLRRFLGVVAIGTVLAVAAPAAHAIPPVEGERGTAVNPFCSSDGEVAGPVGMSAASGGAGFLFPESGCIASYGDVSVVTGVVYRMTGLVGAVYCGYFTFTIGASQPACGLHGTVVVASASGVLPGEVTWHTLAGTPSWVNAIVDVYV